MTKRQNVLVILCDQMRPFELGCYGHPVVQTPHLDALASDGIRFEHGLSNNPVCVPARSILLSGQYSRTCTGSLWNHAPWWPPTPTRQRLVDQTLPECFQAAGYRTHHIGKWHVDPAPNAVGFDHSVAAVRIGSHGQFSDNGGDPYNVAAFSEDYQLQCAETLFRDNNPDPFFCYYNIYWPHMPLAHMPLTYQRQYQRSEVQLRPNVATDQGLPFDEDWFQVYLWEHPNGPGGQAPITNRLPDGFDLTDLTALYYGAIQWVDDIVGALLHRLEQAGLADDTIVLFTSDHGDNLGSHQVWNKDRFWEESIRIPFLMRGPGIDRAVCNHDEQAQLIDVMPTMLDLAGCSVPSHVQGRSLAPIASGTTNQLDRDIAYIETGSYECVARTTTTKVVQRIQRPGPPIKPWLASPDDATDHFVYDLKNDPFELTNLSGQQASAEMDRALAAWDAATPWLPVS